MPARSGRSRMAEVVVVDVAQLIDERPIGGFQILVAVLCALAVFMDGFDTQMVGYVLPAIAKSLQIPPAALTPVVVSGLVGLMTGALVFGIVADRIGRKPVIIFCLIVFGAFMLLTPTASSVHGLMVWRVPPRPGPRGGPAHTPSPPPPNSPPRRPGPPVLMAF